MASEIFAFGEFVLDCRERRLLRKGTPVALTGKAFDVLASLVRRAGHLATKDELLSDVWPNTFVDEVNLSVNISAVRKALGDGNGERFIETVPRRGYRFVAPVQMDTVLELSGSPFTAGQYSRHLP